MFGEKLLFQAIYAMTALAALFAIYRIFPALFLLVAGLGAMAAIVFAIRSFALAIDRRQGGGRLD